MSFTTEDSKLTLLGNGVTTVFPYNFLIYASTHLAVYLDGVRQSTGYTVDGVGVALGGNVTFSTPPANGTIITFNLEVPFTQELAYTQGGKFPSASHEKGLDLVTMLCRRLNEVDSRALLVPQGGDSTEDLTLPSQTDRASKFLGFDASGNPIAAAGTSADLGPVSPFINTLLDDVDAPAAQTTLGVLPLAGGTMTGDLVIATSDARTNTIDVPLIVSSVTSGVAAPGIGTAIQFRAESADENPSILGDIGFYFEDVTAGSEDAIALIGLRRAGGALSYYRFSSSTGSDAVFTHGNTAQRTYTFPDATGNVPTIASQAEVNAMTSTTTALTPNHQKIVTSASQATTSGTTFDFTIPAGVRAIHVLLNEVSLSGTDNILIQLGDAGGIENTGYVSSSGGFTSSATTVVSSTAGFIVYAAAAAGITTGIITLRCFDPATFTWIGSHAVKRDATQVGSGGGVKTLSQELTTVRLTITGVNTFDAGSAAVSYER